MSIYDFKIINCANCDCEVWVGVTWAGFTTKLDMEALGLAGEVLARAKGLMTFEITPTQYSFEAMERSLNRIRWAKPMAKRVILAKHLCRVSLAVPRQPPAYFRDETNPTTIDEGYGF
jgi:hypothetical protein